MSKPVILFNQEGLNQLYNLNKDYNVSDIHKNFYNRLSRMLIYKSVERAKIFNENPTDKLRRFLFPDWVGRAEHSLISLRDIPEAEFFRYKNVFVQPVKEWVLVGFTMNNDGRWYSKDTLRKDLI